MRRSRYLILWCMGISAISFAAYWQFAHGKELPKVSSPKQRDLSTSLPFRNNMVERYEFHAEDYFADDTIRSLCLAIETHDTEQVYSILKKGCDVHVKGKSGVTLLHWALLSDNLIAFQILLKEGADPDDCLTENVEINDHQILYAQDSILFCCRGLLKHDFLLYAIDCTTEPNRVNRRGDALIHELVGAQMQWTSICTAAIVARGADVNLKNSDGRTAINRAMFFGTVERILLLLRLGASPSETRGGEAQIARFLEEAQLKLQRHPDDRESKCLAETREILKLRERKD